MLPHDYSQGPREYSQNELPKLKNAGEKRLVLTLQEAEGKIDSISEIMSHIVSSADLDKKSCSRLVELLSGVVDLTNVTNAKNEKRLVRNFHEVIGKKMKLLEEEVIATHSLLEKNDLRFLNQMADLIEINQACINRLPTPSDHKEILSTLSNNKSVMENLTQVAVLNQYEDGTTSGFENCGFHALKNCLLLGSSMDAAEMGRLLNDKNFFLTFYKTLCLPHVQDKKMGSRDASLPVLQEVVKAIKSLPLSHPLAALNSPEVLEKFGAFQMSTSDGSETGNPLLLFSDTRQALDGLKLFQFAKDPGPSSLSLVVGNAGLGHWFTVNINKSETGELSFFGSDSMGASHETLGNFSPFGKLVELLKQKIENCDEFLRFLYSPIDDELSKRAGWFEADRSISEEKALALLDDEPNPLLVSEEAPTGSSRERGLSNCLAAFQVVETGNWGASSDYWKHQKIQDLELLVDFYLSRLPSDHPLIGKLGQISESLKKRQPEIKQLVFEEAIQAIEEIKETISPTAYERTKTLFTFMRTLDQQRESFIQIKNENERMNAMNKKTLNAGVEPGFVTGSTANDASKSLSVRVDTLLLTYQEAKKGNRLKDFVNAVANGDGCLTARMGRVAVFQAQLLNVNQIEDVSSTAIKEFVEYVLSDLLINAYESEEDVARAIESATVDDLLSGDRLELCAQTFKRYSSSPLARHFKQFLLTKGVVEDVEAIDWIDALDKMRNMPELRGWLNAAKPHALRDL